MRLPICFCSSVSFLLIQISVATGQTATSLATESKNRTDSLERVIQTWNSPADTNKMRILHNLAQSFFRTQPEKAMRYAQEGLEIARGAGHRHGIADALVMIGFAYYSQGRYEEALRVLLESYSVAKNVQYGAQIASSAIQISNTYWRRGLYTIALEYGFLALRAAQEIQDSRRISFAYIALGNIYRTQYEYTQAKEYLREALRYSSNDTISIPFASTLGIMSEIELAEEHLQSSLAYAYRSLRISQLLNDTRGLSYGVYDAGMAWFKLQQYDSAAVYLSWSLGLREEITNRQGIAQSCAALAEAYFANHNLDKALFFAKRAYSIADSIGARPDKQRSLYLMAEIYALHGQNSISTEYFRLSARLKDSLVNDEIVRRAAWKDNQFEKERNDRRLNVLEAEREKETVVRNSLIGGVLLTLMLLGLAYSRYRTKLRSENALLQQQQIVEKQANSIEQANEKLQEQLETLKRTQSQLVQSEKMASLGTLVAGVSHELNTPIGVAMTAASTLKTRTEEFIRRYKEGGLRKTELENYVESAQIGADLTLRNLERAAELVQSFKRVAVDQTNDEKRSFNLGQYLHEIATSLQPMLKGTPHTIEINCQSDVQIENYPGAFAQIITNLVQNSLKHGFDGFVGVGVMLVVVRKHDKQLVLEYSDNGCGISPEVLPRIFDPFFTTKQAQGGTGLGMHVVYNLVTQKLGGEIRCESEVAKGTTFIVELLA